MDERRKLLSVILIATLVFALALGAVLTASALVKSGRAERIEAALERGDTNKAEKLIARLEDGEEKTAYENRCRML